MATAHKLELRSFAPNEESAQKNTSQDAAFAPKNQPEAAPENK